MSKERLFKELPSHKSNRKQDVCVLWARAGVLPVPFYASLIVITVQAGSCDTNSYNYAIMREACENQLISRMHIRPQECDAPFIQLLEHDVCF